MKSLVVKRSVVIGNRKTSVSIEEAFWKALKSIAEARRMGLSQLITAIDRERANGNLSSALRLFVLEHYRKQLEDRDDRQLGIEQAIERFSAAFS
jgi:predicted DNA-binding ribbon-helix-helix protein